MQLTHVFVNRTLPPIASGGQYHIKVFSVGMKCSDAYGGGVIASITHERNGSIVVRKDRPFTQKGAQFDCVVILPGGEYAYGIDDKPAEQKQAQQAQQPKGK